MQLFNLSILLKQNINKINNYCHLWFSTWWYDFFANFCERYAKIRHKYIIEFLLINMNSSMSFFFTSLNPLKRFLLLRELAHKYAIAEKIKFIFSRFKLNFMTFFACVFVLWKPVKGYVHIQRIFNVFFLLLSAALTKTDQQVVYTRNARGIHKHSAYIYIRNNVKWSPSYYIRERNSLKYKQESAEDSTHQNLLLISREHSSVCAWENSAKPSGVIRLICGSKFCKTCWIYQCTEFYFLWYSWNFIFKCKYKEIFS